MAHRDGYKRAPDMMAQLLKPRVDKSTLQTAEDASTKAVEPTRVILDKLSAQKAKALKAPAPKKTGGPGVEQKLDKGKIKRQTAKPKPNNFA